MSKERIKALNTQIETLSNNAHTLYAEMESDEKKRTSDNREKWEKMLGEGEALVKERDNLARMEMLSPAPKTEAKVGGQGGQPTPETDGLAPVSETVKAWGKSVIESDAFKGAQQSGVWPAAVKVRGMKGVTSDAASAGSLVRTQREPEVIDTARQRPFSVIDIVGKGETNSNGVEYVEISSRTVTADFVPELDTGRTHVTAGTGITNEMIAFDNGNLQENFATKPKGNLVFNLKTAYVKTIPEWIPVARSILRDAPALEGLINDDLTYVLRMTLEEKILLANVSGFVGILNAPGVATRVHKVSGRGFDANDKVADTLRRMQTDIQMSFYEMDAYIVSPPVSEKLELEKGSDGHYVMVYDPVTQRVWRKRVVVSNALNAANGHEGTAIAGNFAIGTKLWDRMETEIRIGEPGLFFLQNALAILGELQAAFAVIRPYALEKATGLLA
ncbi:MAG TPA: phage major capsid protein [Pyrinomonadaceae bacterium]|nr:phage major capsid protein [Pyrinomonadaceae bacterium]